MLNQIQKADIQRITSGQVIIDLLSIVKELVENSIDASSDLIEIAFKEHGLETIEINDNGHGIPPEDHKTLCLKHFTSKISRFEDLDSVQTLGFRGEALSSICSVASVQITTSTKESLPGATELEYDHMGELVKQEIVLNKRTDSGMKISVSDIFKNLPVRQKNFVKNIKKEFNKMISFLYNYIIINPQIKFVVTNSVAGKKKVLISTQRTGSLLNNFIIIYGTKSVESLKPIDIEVNSNFKVSGYISSLSIGKGRSIKDKQHLYLNNRPIIHSEMMKLINEVYNQFNNLQFPVFILNVLINDSIDVNLNPDKTRINFSQDLNEFRQELVRFWESENMEQQLVLKPSKDPKPQDHKPKPDIISTKRIPIELSAPKPKKPKFANYMNEEIFKTQNLKTTVNSHYIRLKSHKKGVVSLKSKDDTHPGDERLVEKEISVSKLQFNQMQLIGQFNLGFILTRLQDNLFIVDQHASDEKYNYEDLKNKFRVQSQQLITPIPLNLNLVEIQKLSEFINLVENNGFKVNDDNQITHLPTYKNIQFDKEDLVELLSQLPCHPILPKINSVLAMKACRKSTMIGQHLNVHTMKKILSHLSELDKPWNCPHGRPTLRHLHDLGGINNKVTDYLYK